MRLFALLTLLVSASAHMHAADTREPFSGGSTPPPHPSVEVGFESEEMETVSASTSRRGSDSTNAASAGPHVSFRLADEEVAAFPAQPEGSPSAQQQRFQHLHTRYAVLSPTPGAEGSDVEADDEDNGAPVRQHTTLTIQSEDASAHEVSSEDRPGAFPFPRFRRVSSSTTLPRAAQEARDAEFLNRSMTPWVQVDGNTLYDRDEYLRQIIEQMQTDAESYQEKAKFCRWCNINWMVFGAITGVAAITISGLGAAEIIDPRLATVITTALGAMSGFMIWMGEQASKASKNYHKAFVAILRRLGVPNHMLPPDPHVSFESFEPGNNGGAAAAEATPRPESRSGGDQRRRRSTLFVAPRPVHEDAAA